MWHRKLRDIHSSGNLCGVSSHSPPLLVLADGRFGGFPHVGVCAFVEGGRLYHPRRVLASWWLGVSCVGLDLMKHVHDGHAGINNGLGSTKVSHLSLRLGTWLHHVKGIGT